MPRRKAADRGFVRQRTRSGCNSCRSRKIKCDGSQPRCLNCVSRGLTCDRQIQLKWASEFSACGRAFGREGVWSKRKDQPRGQRLPWTLPPARSNCHPSPRPIESYHFISASYNDLEEEQPKEHPDILDATSHFALSPAQSHPARGSAMARLRLHRHPTAQLTCPSPYPSFVGFDSELLEYYFHHLCPMTRPPEQNTSPFVDLILPLFASGGQEFALLSVMAFSARHRSLHDPRWSSMALSLKGKVLTILRQRISLPHKETDAILDPQIPLAMMFLCLDEIVDNCDYRWVVHLRASQNLLYRRKQLLSTSPLDGEHRLVSFAERFFAFQDVISRTACGNSSHFGLEYWLSPERQMDPEGWMGCSPALASLIFRITELGRAREAGRTLADDFEIQASSLEEELVRWDLSPKTCYDRLMLESVMLYHHCLLYNASPSMPLVTSAISKILRMVDTLVKADHTAGLAFPLFVAAVELDPLNDEVMFDISTPVNNEFISGRRFVLESLHAMSKSSLFNISRTRAVIQKIWTMRDLSLCQESRETAPHTSAVCFKTRNDWNTYVTPFCTNISLA